MLENRGEVLNKLKIDTNRLGVFPVPIFVDLQNSEYLDTYIQCIKTEYCAVIPCWIDDSYNEMFHFMCHVSTEQVNNAWNECIKDDLDYIIISYEG